MNLFWDFDWDSSGRKEEKDWVNNKSGTGEFRRLVTEIKLLLNIPDTLPNKATCAERLLHELDSRKVDIEKNHNYFLYATAVGSNCLLSEFASFHYLRNANHERLSSMD